MRNIDVTGADLRELIRAAYELSRPQGLGIMHHRPGPLDEGTVDTILSCGTHYFPVSMDYVHGRSCKFGVWRDEKDHLWISGNWLDHTEHDLSNLLDRCGVPA